MPDTACPTLLRLGEFLERSLPEDLRLQVEAHVEACGSCQQVLEQRVAASKTNLSGSAGPIALEESFLATLYRRVVEVIPKGRESLTSEKRPS
ncbi:hypothetical protein BH11PLA2_BH11PLA2_41650 [soil metagenome]